MKKSVKLILLGFIILAAAAGGIYSMTAALTVPLTPVKGKTAELTFHEQGIVSAGNAVWVYPLTQGRLLQVNVQEGQLVSAGDIICVIDAETLLLRTEELRGVIKGYEAQMKAAEIQERSSGAIAADRLSMQSILIEQNQRDLARAQEDLGKMELLYAEGWVSQSEVDAIRTLAEKCQAALTASRHELSVIAAGSENIGQAEYFKALLESSKATLALLEREIENCSVKAAATGVITRLPISSANIVSLAVPVAEITARENARIEAYVSTQDVHYVKTGDSVELILKRREGDLILPGRISRVDSIAETRFSALGVEERKVKVHIIPETAGDEEALLGIGFSVDVRFILYREENKLAVPKTALFKEDGRDMLWVVRGGKAQKTAVTAGMELRTETLIESGLVEGDFVVTDANNKSLRNGVSVKSE